MPTEAARRARAERAARSAADSLRRDVLAGLAESPKRLPCKHFYDRRGSELFDRICEQPEYYPTRTELAIVREHADEIAAAIGPGVALVEYGSGSSVKTRRLLDALPSPVAYLPVDISAEHLGAVGERLAKAYPAIDVLPVPADFTRPIELPAMPRDPSHLAVYFPGSTIGNFTPGEAATLLRHIADLVGSGGGLVIGVDLRKDVRILEAAYNDAAGVTAAFNKNLLVRVRDELGADVDVDAFEHRATYDAEHGRIDMELVSLRAQSFDVAGRCFRFAAGEAIHTEHSHKHTVEGFASVAAGAGFDLRRVWTDAREWFAVMHLVVEAEPPASPR